MRQNSYFEPYSASNAFERYNMSDEENILFAKGLNLAFGATLSFRKKEKSLLWLVGLKEIQRYQKAEALDQVLWKWMTSKRF